MYVYRSVSIIIISMIYIYLPSILRQKQTFHFSLQTDPLISDCPDYGTLAPRTTVRMRRLQLKSHTLGPAKSVPKRENEEEAIDELRMCPTCTKLIHRFDLIACTTYIYYTCVL